MEAAPSPEIVGRPGRQALRDPACEAPSRRPVLDFGSVAPTVRGVDVDGFRILLNLEAESYAVLDERASAFWAILAGDAPREATFDALQSRYEVEPDRLTAAFERFAQTCVAQGLLVEPSRHAPLPPAVRRAPPIPRSAWALVCLAATQWNLVRHGFRRTYEDYARLATASPARPPSELLAAFSAAENLYVPRRAPDDCLPRSLALFRYLRSLGAPAEHVIGVRRVPFGAHAWVEVDGQPLLDADHIVKDYRPIARLHGRPS